MAALARPYSYQEKHMAGWVQAITIIKDFVPRLIDVDNLLKAFLNSRREDGTAIQAGLTQINTSHASLQRSLDQHTEAIATLTDEVRGLRAVSSSLAERLQNIEASSKSAATWSCIASIIATLALIGVAVLFFHHA